MVSVIVPVYNVSKYIRQCLESICKQTYDKIEIIIVDDGSTDGGGEICDEFAAIDRRVTVIHQENQGLVCARKNGLAISRGEYITYVDGDDWVETDMLKKLVEVVEREKVDIVIHGRFFDIGERSIRYYQGFEAGRYDKDRLREEVYPSMIVNKGFMEWGIFPNVWDKLFRREILFECQMRVDDKLTMGEDAACVYPCMLKADSVYIMDECFYHYRQNDASMVRSKHTVKNEKEMYRRLFYSVKEALSLYGDIHRIMDQWKDYMLFLMIPRSDVLFYNFDKQNYLFPYPEVKKGDSVIIYGAGVYGKRLYDYLTETGFCDVKGIVDQNYRGLSYGTFQVMSPEEMDEVKSDHIIIAISFEKAREAAKKELSKRFGQNRVKTMDLSLIRSIDTWKEYGME